LRLGNTNAGAGPLPFDTKWDEVSVIYHTPEAAGAVNLTYTFEPLAPGYRCVNWEASRSHRFLIFQKVCTYTHVMNVRVGYLYKLTEESGYNHVVARNDTTNHPEGTYGTAETLYMLTYIAGYYRASTGGRKLSVNDLSLPYGGLFDLNSNWAPKHDTHRDGKDADINHEDGGGGTINCQDKESADYLNYTKLTDAAAAIYGKPDEGEPGLLYPWKAKVKCESNGNLHIDFEY
jgi:hypothetical protein